MLPGAAGVIFATLDSPNVAYAATWSDSAQVKISDPKNFTEISRVMTNKYKYSVYFLLDKDNNVKYVGRTRQELDKRGEQHQKESEKSTADEKRCLSR